ncbi:to reverse transcriptase (Pfam: rvt.hmm, score 19.29) [Cucumis melo var. makuwa]|uniref:To reverse transcriptase (Pfam: rvt.hmm, score 19.29) n=1 Tax=Cucumis melo var. makuwa TaxID=1194695 RepID=A0A5D3E1C2_CUCMM|nr:to reverse transcriptase (Pfam: rvt.hmm, score 19.29) [Cucumis melo var. makuwa]
MQDSKGGFLPMAHGMSLCKNQCPKTQDERERMQKILYASAMGSIMYAKLCTRPDVSCSLSLTSRYKSDLGEAHWTIVKHILKRCELEEFQTSNSVVDSTTEAK